MKIRNEDIHVLRRAIEKIQLDLGDLRLGPVFWEGAVKDFMRKYSDPLLGLLDELEYLREKVDGGSTGKDTHRVILEGHSDKDAAGALSDALNKASHYFSEQHDISITLQQLIELPKGGHRATIEIHITPMTLRDKCHPQSMDVELNRINAHDFAARKKFSEEHIKHLVFDHFAAISGGPPTEIPDYFLININDAQLMNNMIEKQFLSAGRMDLNEQNLCQKQILVRVQRPAPHPHTDEH